MTVYVNPSRISGGSFLVEPFRARKHTRRALAWHGWTRRKSQGQHKSLSVSVAPLQTSQMLRAFLPLAMPVEA